MTGTVNFRFSPRWAFSDFTPTGVFEDVPLDFLDGESFLEWRDDEDFLSLLLLFDDDFLSSLDDDFRDDFFLLGDLSFDDLDDFLDERLDFEDFEDRLDLSFLELLDFYYKFKHR